MAKGNFILKHAGQVIPKPVLERIIAECPTAYGMAMVQEDKTIDVQRVDGAADVDELMQLQENEVFKQKTILFAFSSFEKGHSDHDIQPIAILLGNSDDEEVLVGAFDGDFPGYRQEGVGLSDQYMVAGHVASELEDLHDAYNGDMDRMDKHLQGEKFTRLLSNLSPDPAVFCFLSGTGMKLIKNFGAPMGEYDWGIVSNKYDIDGVKTVPAAEAGGRKSAFASFRNKLSQNKVPDAAKEKGTTIGDKVSADPIASKVSPERLEELRAKKLATSTPSMAIKENATLMIKPHHSWKTGNDKEIIMYLYRNFSADSKSAPGNWKQKPEVKMKAGSHEALKTWLASLKTPLQLSDVVLAGDAKAPVTAMADALKKAEVKKAVPGVHTINEAGAIPDPIDMTANDSELAAEVSSFKKDMLPKLRDSNSQVILDPKKIASLEKKEKTFTDLSGIKFDHAVLFPEWAYAQLIEQYPLMARRLMAELRNNYRDMAVLAEEVTAPVEEPTKVEEPTPEPQKEVVADPAPAAAKRPSAFAAFSRKKAA